MNQSFSIILSVLNSANTLQRCIDSVTNQTYPYKELIIIDGESIDGTVEILQANDPSIDYWESKKDSGIYNAFNKALEHATGDWIYFIGADDYLFSLDILEIVAQELCKISSDYKVVYGKVCIISRDDRVLFDKGKPWKILNKRAPYPFGITHQGVFHHRNIFKDFGRFDESFLVCGDIDLLLRVLKNDDPYYLANLTIAAKGYHGISNNPGNKLLILKEVSIAYRKNGLQPITLQWLIEYFWALSLGCLTKMINENGVRSILKIYCKVTNQPPYWEKY